MKVNWMVNMVVGIVLLKFEMNRSETGDLDPLFRNLVSSFSEDYKNITLNDLVTQNDLYGLFFNHTSGSFFKEGDAYHQNFVVERLKETPFKIISYYLQTSEELQFLIISFFKMDENSDLVEGVIEELIKTLRNTVFDILPTKANDFMNAFMLKDKEIEGTLNFYVYQIERTLNLDKIQKVALLYTSPECLETLELLRKGPISREFLTQKLEKMNENVNVDLILKPFLDLNIIRKDWAKGVYDRTKGKVYGEGEYIFLVKDIALVRRPPYQVLKETTKDTPIFAAYREKVKELFKKYYPFGNITEESKILARCLIDPEIYNFLTLIKHRLYPRKKIDGLVTKNTDFTKNMEILTEVGLISLMLDDAKMEWVALIAEIHPLVIFPEYLINNMENRIAYTREKYEEIKEPGALTPEIVKRALNLLDFSYNETLDF